MIKNRFNLRNMAKITVAGLASFKKSAMLCTVAVSAMLMFAACKDDEPNKHDPVINPIEPVIAEVTADKETTVGVLKTDGFQITIPAGAFDADVTINVTNSDKEVENAYKKSGAFTCLSSPISITIDGKDGTVWLKELATISFPLPASFAVTPENIYLIFGSFYNPVTKSVDYIYPDWKDLKKGIITFTTSHFSDPAAVIAKEEEAFKKFAKDKASEFLKEEKQKTSSETNSMLADLYNDIYDQMGITDPSVKSILVTGALKETDFGALAVAVREGDLGGFTGKVSEMAANYLLDKMKLDPGVNAAMVNIQSATITGAVNAIAHAINGDYTEAAKAIAEAFLEYTFPPTKFIKLGIELINFSVASWNDYELEHALWVFENKGFTGSISNADWDIETTTASMAAYLRSVQHAAIQSYCKINGVNESQLDASELDRIRSKAETDLKKMLEDRLAATALAKQKEAEYLNIIRHFKDDELLDYFDYDMTMDFRLKRLFLVRETILNMVGGPLIHPDGLRSPEECLRDATYYYVRVFVYERGGRTMKPGGRQDFIDWLISEGYIEEKKQEIVWVLASTAREDGTGAAPNPNDFRFNFSTTYISLGSAFTGTYEFLGNVYVEKDGIISTSPEKHTTLHPDGVCTCSLIPGETYTASCEFTSVPQTIRPGDVVNFAVSVSVSNHRKEATYTYIPAMTASLRSSANWNISRSTFAQVNPKGGRLEASNSLSMTFTKAYFPAAENEQAIIEYGFGSAKTTYIYKSVKQ